MNTPVEDSFAEDNSAAADRRAVEAAPDTAGNTLAVAANNCKRGLAVPARKKPHKPAQALAKAIHVQIQKGDVLSYP